MRKTYTEDHIRKFITDGVVSFENDVDLNEYVQPGSIDIPVGKTAYLVKDKFIPFNNNVEYVVGRQTLQEISLEGDGGLLLKGQTYLIPSVDIDLPEDMEITLSPKSSIGRVDLLVRAIFDHVGYYDMIPAGAKGRVWLEVTPQSFNIRLKENLPVNQMKFFKVGDYSDLCLEDEPLLYDFNGKLVKSQIYNRDNLVFALNVPKNEIIGYVSRPTNNIIDLSKVGELEPEKFFTPIYASQVDTHGKITLEKDHFYILCTKECVSIPNHYSAEMIPIANILGDLRVHYAGFFDPGFGYRPDGETNGNAGVLEIRPYETLTVYDGQPICLMEFFENIGTPKKLYGFAGNNYGIQKGPRLSKYFKVKKQ